MNYLDTRDLETEREDLKQTILNAFIEDFPDYEDMTGSFEDIRFEEEELEDFCALWGGELEDIEAIDDLENEIGSEWNYGVTLIDENDFEDYAKDLVIDWGDLPSNIPSYIENNINWSGVADDLKVDYTEVNYKDGTYLFR